MPMSASERMRKYRLRLKENPETYSRYLQKEKERWKQRRESGTVKPTINDMDTRTQRKQRREWRNVKRQQRAAKKARDDALRNATVTITPPASPDEGRPSRAKVGRKRIKRDRAAAYRKIAKLEQEIKQKSRLAEKYRKRFERLQTKRKAKLTPNMSKLKEKLNKERLMQNIIFKEVKRRMTSSNLSEEKKRLLSGTIASKHILKKYRLLGHAQEMLGISMKRLRNQDREHKQSFKLTLSKKVRSEVKEFLEEDINSRLLPGKRDTITRKGVKMQKRYLNDTLKALHKKFLEIHERQISYSMFCKMRPFWIVPPKCSDRDTCTCKIHANMGFMLDRLKQNGVIKLPLKEVCANVCCKSQRKECMYRECQECKDKKLDTENDYEEGKQIWVYTWVNRNEERKVQRSSGESIINVQVTVKEKQYFTLETLLEEANKLLTSKFCRHVYNITHQYMEMKTLKGTVEANEAIIHIDFSENYACKLTDEVQGMHFGASRNQVSIHTGVLYSKESNPASFATFSASNRHDPSSIWAHLHPIIKDLMDKHANIDTVHFISDGPKTQYRSKKNFYLIQEKGIKHYGLKQITWNFTEAGHGKGASDGVGGLLKRTADSLVAMGQDITNVDELYEALVRKDMNVHLYKVPDQDIYDVDKILTNTTIATIPGTMLFHQLCFDRQEPGVLVRSLSCFCKRPQTCNCFNSKQVIKKTQCAQPETCSSDQEQRESSEHGCGGMEHIIPSVDMIGKWVIVKYDHFAYPGIVQDLDHTSLEVKTMSRIGKNRFFWPLLNDIIWYDLPNVLRLIPGVEPVTKRHMQIPPNIWEHVCEAYDVE